MFGLFPQLTLTYNLSFTKDLMKPKIIIINGDKIVQCLPLYSRYLNQFAQNDKKGKIKEQKNTWSK